MNDRVSDIGFTPAVKSRQEALGSRQAYDRATAEQDWPETVTAELAEFLATRESFYIATVSENGHPYIQHRGGPKGFLKAIDEKTLAFADLGGNQQYISLGNLDGNDRVHLFFMDYANQQRIKLWGHARVVDDDPALLSVLTDPAYRGRPERAFVITVDAWDRNCPQHIPELHDVATIRMVTEKLSRQVAELRAENAELKGWLGQS